MEIALVGMPNCGKSTLFNRLTGKNARTGNRAGVTVSVTKGKLRADPRAVLTDLPGIYSPVPQSRDEALTLQTLAQTPPDLVLFVADGTQLSRADALFEAIRRKHRTVLVVNMCDELEKAGTPLDSRKLQNFLDLPVFAVSAKSGRGIFALSQYLRQAADSLGNPAMPAPSRVGKSWRGEESASRRGEENTSRCGEETASGRGGKIASGCVGCAFGCGGSHERKVPASLSTARAFAANGSTPATNSDIPAARGTPLATRGNIPAATARADEAGTGASEMKSRTKRLAVAAREVLPPPPPRGRLQNLADRLFLTPWTGFPLLLLFLSAALFLSFGSPGALLAARFSALLALPLQQLISLISGSLSPFFAAFLKDGVLAGTVAVLDFAPRLFLLFLFLTVMEDSGYLARAGALAAPILRFFGLSGEAAVPLLLGIGCSVPAVLSARHIGDGGTRRLTLLLVPFIPCSARLPVLAVLAALFFASPLAARVIPVLGGVILFLLFAFLLSRKNKPAPFVGELPRFRVPSIPNVLRISSRRTGHFLKKAGLVIPLAAAILWLLSHITPRGLPTAAAQYSVLARISGAIAPIFAPLGFGCWQAVAALLSGIAAKETVLSALAVFAGGDLSALSELLSPRGALSFLCFFATYCPCVATASAVRREGGWRALAACLALSFLGAFALSFAVFHL